MTSPMLTHNHVRFRKFCWSVLLIMGLMCLSFPVYGVYVVRLCGLDFFPNRIKPLCSFMRFMQSYSENRTCLISTVIPALCDWNNVRSTCLANGLSFKKFGVRTHDPSIKSILPRQLDPGANIIKPVWANFTLGTFH